MEHVPSFMLTDLDCTLMAEWHTTNISTEEKALNVDGALLFGERRKPTWKAGPTGKEENKQQPQHLHVVLLRPSFPCRLVQSYGTSGLLVSTCKLLLIDDKMQLYDAQSKTNATNLRVS